MRDERSPPNHLPRIETSFVQEYVHTGSPTVRQLRRESCRTGTDRRE